LGSPLEKNKKAKSAASCRQGNRNEYLNAMGEGLYSPDAQHCDLADLIISQLSIQGNAT
jgi:hypothetical protein